MSLEIRVTLRRGGFALRAELAAEAPAVALFGPSGAGKTTLAHAVLGLERPETGVIRVGGETLFDAARGLDRPPRLRRIGAVFQEGRLFPHLSVRGNLLFGRRFAPASAPGPSLDEVAALLGLELLLARRPAALSGGERQRVAIGRALLSRPRLLVMDEPLASLDAARKAEILPYLERLRDEAWTPILYVSHSAEEVRRLAQVVARVGDGQAGPALAVEAALGPGPAWLAARVSAREGRRVALDLEGLRLWLDAPAPPVGEPARLRVEARDVLLAPRGVEAAAQAALPARVEAVEGAGALRLARLRVPGGALLAEAPAEALARLGLRPGAEALALLRRVVIEPGLNRSPTMHTTRPSPGNGPRGRKRGAGA